MSHNNDYGFFYNIRQTVYKWWCVVYKPTYKLFHHGYWPAEKEPYYQANLAKQEGTSTVSQTKEHTDTANISQTQANVDTANVSTQNAQDLANQILSSKQGSVDAMVANTTPLKQETSGADKTISEEPEIDLSKVDADALARANEIMARLASEAAADEAKKQAEIDAAKAKARADEEAAKAKAKEDEDAAKARADEIMARLAAEAAADEAKKQAEIDVAKAKAKEDEMLASILKSTKVDISAFIAEGKAQRQDKS